MHETQEEKRLWPDFEYPWFDDAVANIKKKSGKIYAC